MIPQSREREDKQCVGRTDGVGYETTRQVIDSSEKSEATCLRNLSRSLTLEENKQTNNVFSLFLFSFSFCYESMKWK